MRFRLRSDEGFGMIELLMAMTMLNIGILAIVAAFNSGAVALRRASQVSTAAALADQQMERYRAVTYATIYLDTSLTAATDSTYRTDSAYNASQITQTCSPVREVCNPSRAVTGADGRSYRVDTYIVTDTPANGRSVKRVTIVVRDSPSGRALARIASTFDASTG